nr:family 20 glycosylhydrolase [uncultured Dyadobacter sp.]
MNTISRLLRVTLLLAGSLSWCFAQPTFPTGTLTYKMVVERATPDAPLKSAVALTNSGKTALPVSGWAIYFNNFKRLQKEENPDFDITVLDGGLYRITPTKNFKPLAPGATTRIKVTAEDFRNLSDLSLGFYIVWDKNPAHGEKIANADPDYLGALQNEPAIAAATFQQNAQLKFGPLEKQIKIFPTPASYRETNGSFQLNAGIRIITDPSFTREANLLAEELAKVLTKKSVVAETGTGKAIFLQKNNIASEAYQLSVQKDKIVVSASSSAGIFYGIQSLKTLLPANAWQRKQASYALPTLEVEDAPRFGHRALLVDVGRNFRTKAELLKVLDLMALYKMNVLHFHLNDDEGWRLEIPGLPELTEVGARRGHTLDEKDHLRPTYGSGPIAGAYPGSGYYTKSDYIELLRFATARHIRVIPEIETPGHARAAIYSMEKRYRDWMAKGQKEEAEKYRLKDPEDASEYRSVQGWRDNVVNVALPSVYNFMEKVTDELLAMYKEANAPLETIHFGGDEVPAGVWEKSPAVKALLEKDASIKDVDELWKYYFSKVNMMLEKRNLYLYGWEEIGMKKVFNNGRKRMVEDSSVAHNRYQMDVWNNLLGTGAEDLAYRMANLGYRVVLSNVTNNYADMAANKSFNEPGMFWAGYVDIDKPYYFIPFDYYKNSREDLDGNPVSPNAYRGKKALTEEGKKNIVGLQIALWGETIETPERFEYMLLPKLLSGAERAWAKEPDWATEADTARSSAEYQLAWNGYVQRVWSRELPRLDYYAGGFAYRVPTAGVLIENGKVTVNSQYPGLAIRYTTDGTSPTINSALYTSPLTSKGNYLFRTFTPKGNSSRIMRVVNQ